MNKDVEQSPDKEESMRNSEHFTDPKQPELNRYRINSVGGVEIFREGYWQQSWEIREGGH